MGVSQPTGGVPAGPRGPVRRPAASPRAPGTPAECRSRRSRGPGRTRRVGTPFREPPHVPVVPRRADDRRRRQRPRPARQPNRRAIRQVIRKTNAQQGEVDPEKRQKVRLPGDRHVPPPHLLTEGDDTQCHHPGGRSAGQGPRDAPRRRARKEGNNDQDDQGQAVKQVKLLRGHAFPSRRQRFGVEPRRARQDTTERGTPADAYAADGRRLQRPVSQPISRVGAPGPSSPRTRLDPMTDRRSKAFRPIGPQMRENEVSSLITGVRMIRNRFREVDQMPRMERSRVAAVVTGLIAEIARPRSCRSPCHAASTGLRPARRCGSVVRPLRPAGASGTKEAALTEQKRPPIHNDSINVLIAECRIRWRREIRCHRQRGAKFPRRSEYRHRFVFEIGSVWL